MSEVLTIPDKKLVCAELARRSHLEFMDFMWQRPDPFIIGQHTEAICEIIDDAIEKYNKGISSYIAIKCCHRHGKSDIVSRYLPANFIGKYPYREVIVAGYGYSLVRPFSKFCRGVMLDPRYQYVYPGVRLDPKQRALDSWGIDGNFGATHWIGVGGSITGKTGDLIILDDFFKGRKEAESEVVRKAVWESVGDDIFTRRSPVSIIIILATPWHVDDVFGRIEKKRKDNPLFPEFKEVKFPAFKDTYSKGILFPERFPIEWYHAEKAFLGPYSYAGLMQCEPIARGGNMFEVDKIQYYDCEPPDGLMWCRGWDLASTEDERISEDPDYTAGVLVGVRWKILPDGRNIPEIFVDDMVDGRWAAPKRDDVIISTILKDGSSVQSAIESFGPYKDAYENISKALYGIKKVKKLQLPGDKVSKASVLEAPIAAGNFHVRKAPWTERYVKQFRVFSGGAHDDYVDGTVVGYEGVNPYEKKIWPQFQRKHLRDLNINWDMTKQKAFCSLHYAGVWMKKDLSVWIVLCLWDAYRGYLFLYDGFVVDEPIPGAVIPKLIDRMKLKNYDCQGIICSPLMWEEKGYSKNIGIQYRKELDTQNVHGKVKEAFNYDEYGSIIEIGQLFDTDMLWVEQKAKSVVLQLISWVTVDRGRHIGAKPDEEDDGYCRALCLVVSELRRQEQWAKVVKPKFMDYARAENVQDAYERKRIR